jgi:hypothetical protein
MAALPVIPGVYLISISYVQGESQLANVFSVLSSSPTTPTDVATHVQGAWFLTNSIADQQSNIVTYNQLSVTPLDGSSLPTLVDLTAESGGIAGGLSAVQSCLVTTFRTNERGRSGRGRMFLGGIPSAGLNSDSTRWDTSPVNNMNTAWGIFMGDLLTHDLSMVVLSRKLGDARVITDRRVNSYLGTQRRRSEREERP